MASVHVPASNLTHRSGAMLYYSLGGDLSSSQQYINSHHSHTQSGETRGPRRPLPLQIISRLATDYNTSALTSNAS